MRVFVVPEEPDVSFATSTTSDTLLECKSGPQSSGLLVPFSVWQRGVSTLIHLIGMHRLDVVQALQTRLGPDLALLRVLIEIEPFVFGDVHGVTQQKLMHSLL